MHKHIQDHLLVQQFSCCPGASKVQPDLTVGGRGTSGALPGPAAVSISKIPRAAEKQIHSSKIHWRLLSVGGHLWPGRCLRLKLLEAAEYYRGIIIPWPGPTFLHQHISSTGDSRGQ